mmetsp:Transcript_66105/g.144380  ORF Transcript_66105/g.144380 Transcript_66105/m.144380 type:complete len:678 (-) Transcript_66105:36-2069(-)
MAGVVFEASNVRVSNIQHGEWTQVREADTDLTIRSNPDGYGVIARCTDGSVVFERPVSGGVTVVKRATCWVEWDNDSQDVHGFLFDDDSDASCFVAQIKKHASLPRVSSASASSLSPPPSARSTMSPSAPTLSVVSPVASAQADALEARRLDAEATARRLEEDERRRLERLREEQAALERRTQALREEEMASTRRALDEERRRADRLQMERDMMSHVQRVEQTAVHRARAQMADEGLVMGVGAPSAPMITDGGSSGGAVVAYNGRGGHSTSVVQVPATQAPFVGAAMMPYPGSMQASRTLGPLGALAGQTGSDGLRRVALLDHQRRGGMLGKHITYSVCPLDRPAACQVERRYSDFELLHKTLQNDSDGLIFIPPLPGKKTFGNQDELFLQRRHRALERYLNRVLSSPLLREHKIIELFLTNTDNKFAKVWQSARHKHDVWRLRHVEKINADIETSELPGLAGQDIGAFEHRAQLCLAELKEQKNALKCLIRSCEGCMKRLRGDASVVLDLGLSLAELECAEKRRLARVFQVPDVDEHRDLVSPSLQTYERVKQSIGLVANSYEREADLEDVLMKEALEFERDVLKELIRMIERRSAVRSVAKKTDGGAEAMESYVRYVVRCVHEVDRFRTDLSTSVGMIFRDYAGAQVRHLVQLMTIWQRHFDIAADVMAPMPRPQ